MTDLAPLPPGPFGLLYADPPWASTTWSGENRTPTAKRGADHYQTMPLEQLKAMDVAAIAAPNSLLAMWTIGSHIDQAIELGRAWGFRYTTDLFYWFKQKRIRPNQLDLLTEDVAPLPKGMGKITRKQAEPCLLFTRGKGLPVLDHGVDQVIIAPRSEHSRKPEEAALRLERLYGTSHARLELFSRTTRSGWSAWGNEVGKFSPAGESCASQAAAA